MKRARKILIVSFSVVFGLIVIVVGAFLISINTAKKVPEVSTFELDIERVRGLSDAPVDSLPVQLNNVLIATAEFIRGQVISGGGFEPYIFHFSTFQLVYGDGQTIIVDPAHDREIHDYAFEDGPFFGDRYDAMQHALRSASLILSTHEHFDHVGGALRSPHFDEIKDDIRLSSEQVGGLLDDDDTLEFIQEEKINNLTKLNYKKYQAVAPGVVLIKAPGHTPGSQLIYVKMQQGTELIFAGDVVWSHDNIRTLTSRSFFSTYLGNEDGEQVANQIRRLHDVERVEGLHVLVAHDGDQRNADLAAGLYKDGFN